MKYQFIRNHHKEYKTIRLCEALEVSPSGFHDWLDRPESDRSRENKMLTKKIKYSHKLSKMNVNNTCFNGGDDTHRRAVKERLRATQNCVDLFVKKDCGCKT